MRGAAMIYLIRDTQIAACEHEDRAHVLERDGRRRASYAAYRWAWKAKDARALRELYPAQERAVGENIVYPTQPWWDKGTIR